jgi:hypothetical protein
VTTWGDAAIPSEGDPYPSEPGPAPPAATLPPGAPPAVAAAVPGLAMVHMALDQVVTARGLRAITVVVDDPDLGRQAFRAGPGPFEPGALGGEPGCRTDPPLPPDALEGDLLVALCAASLRVEVLRDDTDGPDALELSFRRLPGVTAVVVERDETALIVQLHAGIDAPADLGRAAARLAAASDTSQPVVIEIVGGGAPRSVTPRVGASPPASASPIPAIVAVRSVPEAGEIEVHLRDGDTRTIGRAPMAEGLAGAAGATLDALRQLAPGLELSLAWARTIETTADRRFVVAVALQRGSERAVRHGLGAGSSPIEGAARGALDAALRADDAAP